MTVPQSTVAGWKAQLSLELKNFNGRTVITSRRHQGPLVIQKPFYPERGPCHLYLLHPPGGLVSGDELTLDMRLANNSHCLMTTPGATKYYRTSGLPAIQKQSFHVGNDALLEWLPQETIVFNKADAQIHTHVELQQHAKYIGWEITCLGRKAGAEPYDNGTLAQKITINRCGKPEFIERAVLQGGDATLEAPWGLANHPTIGMMVITPAGKPLLETVRNEITYEDSELFSTTLMDNVFVCRYLGAQAEAAKRLFIKVWKAVRPHVQNIEACTPRIWNT